MKHHVIVEDQDRELIWFDSDDVKAFFWFVAFVGLFIAWTAVQS